MLFHRKGLMCLFVILVVGVFLSWIVIERISKDVSNQLPSNELDSFSQNQKNLLPPSPQQQTRSLERVNKSTNIPNGNGPWQRDLVYRLSKDGTVFGEEQLFLERAGVPSIIRDGEDRLIAAFQWFPENNQEQFDQVAIMISEDDGLTWSEPETVIFDDLPESYQRPFDPTLTLTQDGRIRMYFTSNEHGFGDPQEIEIYSALSKDGIHYVFEPDTRFQLSNFPTYDSAVFLLDHVWHIFTPSGNTATHHGTSRDGLSFTIQSDITEISYGWIGNLLADGSGMRFYGTPGWWAYSEDGFSWTEPTFLGFDAGDPAVIRLKDGRYFMIYVSAIRR